MHYKKEHGDFPAGFEGMAIWVVNYPREREIQNSIDF